MSDNAIGYWWSSSPDEGWEGFAPSREEALKQVKTSRYHFGDEQLMEIHLRPGHVTGDELESIRFTGPGEVVTVSK